jgi:hypothetical protein
MYRPLVNHQARGPGEGFIAVTNVAGVQSLGLVLSLMSDEMFFRQILFETFRILASILSFFHSIIKLKIEIFSSNI